MKKQHANDLLSFLMNREKNNKNIHYFFYHNFEIYKVFHLLCIYYKHNNSFPRQLQPNSHHNYSQQLSLDNFPGNKNQSGYEEIPNKFTVAKTTTVKTNLFIIFIVLPIIKLKYNINKCIYSSICKIKLFLFIYKNKKGQYLIVLPLALFLSKCYSF